MILFLEGHRAFAGSASAIIGDTDGTLIGNVNDELKMAAYQITSPWVTSRNWTLGADTDTVTTELTDASGNEATIKPANTSPTAADTGLVVALSPNSAPLGMMDSTKATYSAAASAFTPASSATDICTLTGSGTKTTRVRRVMITGVESSIANQIVLLIKRSSADSGGTSSAMTVVPRDSNDAAATATAKNYTANPTLGTTVGTILTDRLVFSPATGGSTTAETGKYDFGELNDKPVVLRSASEVLAVNLNSVTIIGGAVSCNFEWTEE